MTIKNTILIIFWCVCTSSVHTYAQSDCGNGSSVAVLDVNNVKAYLPINGTLWNRIEDNDEKGGYIFPNDTPDADVSAFFTAGLWFGGINSAGEASVSAITYEPFWGDVVYSPGPLDSNTGITDEENCSNWDRHFQTTQADIDAFLDDWADGSLDNEILSSILGWPAKRNPFFFDVHGFELPNTAQSLAPFYDQNMDGKYNPQNGDYPLIKEATQAVWWVLNTSNPSNFDFETSPTLEIQMMAYAYDSPNQSINNSTFYDVKYINRGEELLDSMFVSLWMDYDLGCFIDDYVGCVPEEDMIFIYNQDDFDSEDTDDCICYGVPSYCEEIPMVGIKLLQSPLAQRLIDDNGDLTIPPIGVLADTTVQVGLSSFSYYISPSVGLPFPYLTDPNTMFEHYHYMNGRFRDNSPIYDSNNEPTAYAYHGNPANSEDWSMCNPSLEFADRKFLMNMGSFRMSSGASNEFTFVVTGVENVVHPCPDIDILTDAMNEVKDLWEGNNIPVSIEPIFNSTQLKVFPNPMTTFTQIALQDAGDLIQQIEVFNVNGQSVILQNGLNTQNATINRKQLRSGIYFYTVLTKKQKIFSGKLMIE